MAEKFEDDDSGFSTWAEVNTSGYVLNIQRSRNTVDARVHRADCNDIARVIREARFAGKRATHAYIKVCAITLAELDEWVAGELGQPVRRCQHCLGVQPDTSRSSADVGSPYSSWHAESEAYSVQVADGAIRLRGPRYIGFDDKRPEVRQARAHLQDCLRTLVPGAGEILQARFSGHRPSNSDIENVLIYNIDQGGASLRASTRHGVRFEESADDRESGCCYSYRLTSADTAFSDWSVGDLLASFTGVDLGAFGAEHRAAQTWFAVKNGAVQTVNRSRPGVRFGIFLELEAPGDVTAVTPELMKNLIDGVVSALQAHRDESTRSDVAAIVADQIGADPADVAARLQNSEQAVLGIQDRLAHSRSDGVQWKPADHLCVAGQVLRQTGDRWRLGGRVCVMEPRTRRHG